MTMIIARDFWDLSGPSFELLQFLTSGSLTRPQVSMALPTHGRVLLDTTAGDIDIELWSRVRDVTWRRNDSLVPT